VEGRPKRTHNPEGNCQAVSRPPSTTPASRSKSFAPFVYYNLIRYGSEQWKDLGLTLDSMVFFFRNDKRTQCIDDTPECERTVENAPDEIRDMAKLVPAGRKLHVGMYFVGLGGGPLPTPRYDYDLTRFALSMPMVGGTTAYGLECPGDNCTDPNPPVCNDFNFLNYRYCALQKAYGSKLQYVNHDDLTPSDPLAASDPSAYSVATDRTKHVIYRSSDNHLHELWWTDPGPVGQGDLIPNGPLAAGDPAAYFMPADGTQHVIYRSGDGHLHELWWTGPGPVGQGGLKMDRWGRHLHLPCPASYADHIGRDLRERR